MTLVDIPVPNLIGGVSQQPGVLRLPGQAEIADNVYPSVVDGLQRRHPTQHLAKMIDGTGAEDTHFLLHAIDRDEEERYLVTVQPDGVKVFDEDGVEYPVHGPTAPYDADFSYLTPRTPNPVNAPEEFTIGTAASGLWVKSGNAQNPVLTAVDGPLPLIFPDAKAISLPNNPTGPGWWTQGDHASDPIGVHTNRTVLSCYFKKPAANDATQCGLVMYDNTHTRCVARWTINQTTGEFTNLSQTNVAAFGVEDVGNGWFRCFIGVDADTTTNLDEGDNLAVEVEVGAAGNPANDAVLAWGVHVRQGDGNMPLEPLPYGEEGDGYKALTVADTTFVLNTGTVVRIDDTLSTTPRPPAGLDEALIFVKQGGVNNIHYTVKSQITGGALNTSTFDTAAGGTIDTANDIAEALRAALDVLEADSSAAREGSVIRFTVSNAAKSIIRLETSDGFGDTALQKIHREVEIFSDLPLIAPDGFVVKIGGRPEDTADDYWVEFVTDDNVTFGRGHWQESRSPNSIRIAIDADTMPHQLTRRQDDVAGTVTGTPSQIYFEWAPVDWAQRLVGDDDSNPFPSFVTQDEDFPRKINEIFFFAGRLGFTSGENVILSEVDEPLNFFRSTVISLPDSELIDVTARHTRVSTLYHAIPYNEQLLLFSDRTQFVLRSDGPLTPLSVEIVPVLEFQAESNTGATPATNGRSIFFGYRNGSFSGIREMFQESEITFSTDNVSKQAPRYIEGAVLRIAASTHESLLAILADGARDTVYAYKDFFTDRDRVQSAWARYTFGESAIVLGAAWIESILYLAIQRTEGVFLERMEISAGQVDAGSAYYTCLDRRIDDDFPGVTETYAAVDNETTFTLPYEPEPGEEMLVVTKDGEILSVLEVNTTPNEIVVNGDYSAVPVWIGQTYLSRFQPTRPNVRDSSSSGGLFSRLAGRLRIMYFEVAYAATAHFLVKVQARGRDAFEVAFNSANVGGVVLGDLELLDGEFRTGVMGNAEDTDVTIESESPLPMALQSAMWECDWTTQSRSGGSA